MHRYEILPIIRLADTLIQLMTDTNNQSDYKFLHALCLLQFISPKFCLIFLKYRLIVHHQ